MSRANPLDSALSPRDGFFRRVLHTLDRALLSFFYLPVIAVSLHPSYTLTLILPPGGRVLVLCIFASTISTAMSSNHGITSPSRSNPSRGPASHEQLLAARLNFIASNPDHCIPSAMTVSNPGPSRRNGSQQQSIEGSVDHFLRCLL